MNRRYTKNLLREQSLVDSILSGFFDFLRSILGDSRKFAQENYIQFKKKSDQDIITVKRYFKWLNENFPLQENELYYIPEDDIDPSNFAEEDFISPFVYANNAINRFAKLIDREKNSWSSDSVTNDKMVFDAILASNVMDGRTNKKIYKQLVDNQIKIDDVSSVLIKQDDLDEGIKTAQNFQKIIASFFTSMALFAKTLQYIKTSNETARIIDSLFANERNLNFLSKDGSKNFEKSMSACQTFASQLPDLLMPYQDAIRKKMPPEYGNYEMTVDEWNAQAKNLPGDFFDIDTKIKKNIVDTMEKVSDVSQLLQGYISDFTNAFIFKDVNYEIEEYCNLEAEICELFVRQKSREEELREKRAEGEEAEYLVDIISDIRKDKTEKEKQVATFKSRYIEMINEITTARSYIRHVLLENLNERGNFDW